MDGVISGCSGRRKSEDARKRHRTGDEEICERNTKLKDSHKRKGRTFDTDSDTEWLEKEGDREKRPKYCRKRSFNRSKDDKSRCFEEDSDVDWAKHKSREKEHHTEGRSSRPRNKDSKNWILGAGSDGECSDKDRGMERHRMHKWKSSRHWNKDGDDWIFGAGSDENWSDRDRDGERPSICKKKSSRRRNRNSEDCIYEGGSDGDWSDRERHHHHKSKGSRCQISHNKDLFYGDGDMETQHDCSRKSSRHKRGVQDDHRDYEDESDEDDGHYSRWERDRRALYRHARKNGKH